MEIEASLLYMRNKLILNGDISFWIQSIIQYCQGLLLECSGASIADAKPGFKHIRRLAAGFEPVFETTLGLSGQQLSAEERSHPIWKAVMEKSTDILAYTNDVISFPKEIDEGDSNAIRYSQ